MHNTPACKIICVWIICNKVIIKRYKLYVELKENKVNSVNLTVKQFKILLYV